MDVRLNQRWGSRLPRQIVSVSPERAQALEDAGIGKILPGQEKPKVEKETSEKSISRMTKDELKAYAEKHDITIPEEANTNDKMRVVIEKAKAAALDE